jgi:hypothetical protein
LTTAPLTEPGALVFAFAVNGDFVKIPKEIMNMKKLLLVLALVISMMTMVGVSACAQDAPRDDQAKAAPAAPLKDIKGTVQADGDKLTFVTDEDQKSWDVMNPEALKGHEGHHVQVSAHVYADKNAIHVMSVKMLK